MQVGGQDRRGPERARQQSGTLSWQRKQLFQGCRYLTGNGSPLPVHHWKRPAKDVHGCDAEQGTKVRTTAPHGSTQTQACAVRCSNKAFLGGTTLRLDATGQSSISLQLAWRCVSSIPSPLCHRLRNGRFPIAFFPTLIVQSINESHIIISRLLDCEWKNQIHQVSQPATCSSSNPFSRPASFDTLSNPGRRPALRPLESLRQLISLRLS